MRIHVELDADPPVVNLEEPEDCRRFHVEARGGDTARLAEVLEQQRVGRALPSGDAMIEVDSVRRMAEGRVPDGWDRDFSAMLDYARSKGWLDEAGAAIQAHVEWESPSG